MSQRHRPGAVPVRALTVLAVLAGIACTAAGPATVTGLLPYFTIQSNVAVGLLAGYAAWLAGRGRPDPPVALRGAVTLYITITGVVYHLVLANPASPFAVAQPDRDLVATIGNQLLHTAVPLLALLDWALFRPERPGPADPGPADRGSVSSEARPTRAVPADPGPGRLRLRHALLWLAFPLAYLGFALVRGSIRHTYPYPFVDAGQLGYDGVAISALGFAVAFWLLGLIFIGTDRALTRTGRAGRGT